MDADGHSAADTEPHHQSQDQGDDAREDQNHQQDQPRSPSCNWQPAPQKLPSEPLLQAVSLPHQRPCPDRLQFVDRCASLARPRRQRSGQLRQGCGHSTSSGAGFPARSCGTCRGILKHLCWRQPGIHGFISQLRRCCVGRLQQDVRCRLLLLT